MDWITNVFKHVKPSSSISGFYRRVGRLHKFRSNYFANGGGRGSDTVTNELATLRANCYKPLVNSLIAWTGFTSLLLAPVGGYAFNLAAITAAICQGEEADFDSEKRYFASLWAGIFYLYCTRKSQRTRFCNVNVYDHRLGSQSMWRRSSILWIISWFISAFTFDANVPLKTIAYGSR